MSRLKENIIPHQHSVNSKMRAKLHGHKAICLWFTGLSGSGKSTIASSLEEQLHKKAFSTYILDGDNIRSGINKDLSFSDKDRVENIRRIGEISKLILDSGTIVLSAFISPFKEDRAQVKEVVGESNFIEIFIDCPLEVCEERDVKGLYKKARAGLIPNFTGISSPFEEPQNPDIRIKSNELSIQESVETIWNSIKNKLSLES